MAEFLNTTGVSYHLERLIKSTQQKLILISPYLQFNERIKEHIQHLTSSKKNVQIVFRENKLQSMDKAWLESQPGITASVSKNLHAKCYLNESEAIITSMNLYEFSQLNNNEMDIFFTKEKEPELYKSTFEEAQRLLTISEKIKTNSNQTKIKTTKTNTKHYGFCIRTGVRMTFNIKKPLSTDAFYAWDAYGDPFYAEKFCHFSGEPSYGETCYDKPVMSKNWKKAADMFGL